MGLGQFLRKLTTLPGNLLMIPLRVTEKQRPDQSRISILEGFSAHPVLRLSSKSLLRVPPQQEVKEESPMRRVSQRRC